MQPVTVFIFFFAFVIGTAAGHCCDYPLLPWSITYVSKRASEFICDEPLSFLCPDLQINSRVAILGDYHPTREIRIVAQERKQEISMNIQCDTSSRRWHAHINGRRDHFGWENFACAYLNSSQQWAVVGYDYIVG